MRKRRVELLLLMVFAALKSTGSSSPGKPVLLGCRSPEKETFTCWWKPGSDGGLPTQHRLYYEREQLEGTYECPDYDSGGTNSCFFNKNHTSIWVDYYLTVVAYNRHGNISSDLLKIDVMEIVKPDAPDNVSVEVEVGKKNPHLYIKWKHPSNTDTKSGWVTIKYQLRIKQENTNEWSNYTLGTQTYFRLYSVLPGVMYMVEVRCALDHGTWSDWTNTTYVKIPNYLQSERPFWMLLSILSVVPLFVTMCVLVIKRKDVKGCLLPPVPGPKIRGVDVQLLQNGQPEDFMNALILNQNFPPMVAWGDQMEEYLVVSDCEEWLLANLVNSQKRQKSSIIPANIPLKLENKSTESPQSSSNTECNEGKDEKCNSEESLSNKDRQQQLSLKLQSPWMNLNVAAANPPKTTSEKTDHILAASSYVDIQSHEVLQEFKSSNMDYSRVEEVNCENVLLLGKENVLLGTGIQEGNSEDYSRVKDVNGDHVVFLQNQSASALLCKEKSVLNPDCTNQKPGHHMAQCDKVGLRRELIGGGYVDSVSLTPLI